MARKDKRDVLRTRVPMSRRNKPEDGMTKFVIDTLLTPFAEAEFTLYMDNYYTSIPLF